MNVDNFRYQYDTWILITNNEFPVNFEFKFKEKIKEDLFNSRNYFPEMGANTLPKRIQRDWLDLFHFYQPNSGNNQKST